MNIGRKFSLIAGYCGIDSQVPRQKGDSNRCYEHRPESNFTRLEWSLRSCRYPRTFTRVSATPVQQKRAKVREPDYTVIDNREIEKGYISVTPAKHSIDTPCDCGSLHRHYHSECKSVASCPSGHAFPHQTAKQLIVIHGHSNDDVYEYLVLVCPQCESERLTVKEPLREPEQLTLLATALI